MDTINIIEQKIGLTEQEIQMTSPEIKEGILDELIEGFVVEVAEQKVWPPG